MRKRDLLARVAATAVCAASILPAFAAGATQDFNGPTDGTAQNATVPVTCEIESGYTVKLPAAIALAKNTVGNNVDNNYAAGYTVSVQGNIASDKYVNVQPTDVSNFVLSDTSGARTVTPNVFANGVSWSATDLGDGSSEVVKGSMIEADIPYAGSYSGTLSYAFGIDSTAATNSFVNSSATNTVVTDAGVLQHN